MKIFRVDVKVTQRDGEPLEMTRLVRAGGVQEARAHVMKVVEARVASQEDVLLAADGVQVEDAAGDTA